MDERPYETHSLKDTYQANTPFVETVVLTKVNPRAPPEFAAEIEAIAKRIAQETGPVPPLPDDS